jgi:hypothetical protein
VDGTSQSFAVFRALLADIRLIEYPQEAGRRQRQKLRRSPASAKPRKGGRVATLTP